VNGRELNTQVIENPERLKAKTMIRAYRATEQA
jgi:hypothetical protein